MYNTPYVYGIEIISKSMGVLILLKLKFDIHAGFNAAKQALISFFKGQNYSNCGANTHTTLNY